MKRGIKTALCTILVLVVLGAIAIGVPQFCLGYDLFDRSGWSTEEDGTLRYLTREGDPLLGWQEIDGTPYYFSPEHDGALATGWLDTADGRYYLGADGVRAIGWTEVNGCLYYFGENGIMSTGWLELSDGRYYLDEQGAAVTGWLNEGGNRYYLDENSRVSIGWTEIDESRYYFAEDGTVVTGWMDAEEGRYYLSETGAMTIGWLELDGSLYYLDESGLLYIGWLELGNRQYYLTESGPAQTGWMETEDGLYYFREDGRMAIGKVEIDGTARYFTSTGKHFVLVNLWNPVPEDYEMDLVEIDGFRVAAVCRDALEEMITDCNAAGHSCKISSAYRSYDRQVFLFERKVTKLMGQGYSREAAEKETALSIAVPGTSEHHLGLAVDMKSSSDTYAWLAEHSWEYGFILRYPYGKTDLTGIYYEPWHFRYVGDELAKELYDLGLCVEEYMNMLTELAQSET